MRAPLGLAAKDRAGGGSGAWRGWGINTDVHDTKNKKPPSKLGGFSSLELTRQIWSG
ncbi:hypothetical protein RI103_02235 [Paraburkholderia sp. FT54]|uniref:hypothetical protein n=1 Tax=Paraburkholderia sp. FT54 TaxID=3074437 RepID=UPI002877FD9C|nr:hypothetical protein [Paraburkholderia sp. FT54]WNC90202.1 hypothetical protein RI103_02235 [Paraburkholderia sp. FT54]